MSATRLIPPPASANCRGAGRLPLAFGRRFYILLLLGLVWIGPAWQDRRYLFGMLAWDVLVMGVWIWDALRLPKPEQLDVKRVWNSAPQLGAGAEVRLELRNRGRVAVRAEMQDDAPASMRGELPQLEIRAEPGETGVAQYAARPGERGDARFGEVYFRYQSPLQVAERWARAALGQTVRIYPNLEEAKKDTIYLIRSRQIALEKRRQNRRGQGREFESLREYLETDERRDICWSATARRAKLISKTYQIERSQAVWLILDTGRLLRARTAGLSKLDYAVGAALSLAQVALYSGDNVALLAYGRKVQQRLPPGRGAGQVRSLLEALAQVRGEELEANHRQAMEALGKIQKRRSLVVWLTDLSETATTPEVVENAMHLARRHLVLFTVIGQPELRAMLLKRPEGTREMFQYAAAQEVAHRRDLLLRRLRQQGVLTLEVEPAKVSSAVVNGYLMAKERNLI